MLACSPRIVPQAIDAGVARPSRTRRRPAVAGVEPSSCENEPSTLSSRSSSAPGASGVDAGRRQAGGRTLVVAGDIGARLDGRRRARQPVSLHVHVQRAVVDPVFLRAELAVRAALGVVVVAGRDRTPSDRRWSARKRARARKSMRSNGAPVVSKVVGVRSKPSFWWRSTENSPDTRSRRKPAPTAALNSPKLPPDNSPVVSNGRGGLAGDQVDHAADRVRPIERGRGALHHFDLFETIHGLAIEIDDAALDAAGAEPAAGHRAAPAPAANRCPGSARRRRRRSQSRAETPRPGTSRSNSATVCEPLSSMWRRDEHGDVGVQALAQLFLARCRHDLHRLDHRRGLERELQRLRRRHPAPSPPAPRSPGQSLRAVFAIGDWRDREAAIAAAFDNALERGAAGARRPCCRQRPRRSDRERRRCSAASARTTPTT